MRIKHLSSLSTAAILVAVLLPSLAKAFDFAGAWASDPEQCGKIYTHKGGRIQFSEMSDLYGSGFIVEANRIRGKAARCAIKSRREESDTLTLLTSCSTDIMLSDVPFTLKIVNDDTITRFFPGMPDMQLNYHRCPK